MQKLGWRLKEADERLKSGSIGDGLSRRGGVKGQAGCLSLDPYFMFYHLASNRLEINP